MVNLLTVKNLAYKYKNSSDYAIKNISFSAEKGDMIALIGKSGSGKTTIINSTLGLFSNIEVRYLSVKAYLFEMWTTVCKINQ